MKKEKKVKTYQRRTKSGKMVTVKAHTAKYDAAEHAKELAKKKGAGDELEKRKKEKFMVLGVDLSVFSDEELKELDFIEYDDNGKAVQAPKTRSGLKRFAEKYYSDPDSADNFREGMADFYAEVKERRKAKKSSEAKVPKSSKDEASSLKVGSSIQMGSALSLGKGGKETFKVLTVQNANKQDRELGNTEVAWVQRKDGSITLALKDSEKGWMYDDTWSDSTDRKNPYAKSLKAAGYSLKKAKGQGGDYWNTVKSKPTKKSSNSYEQYGFTKEEFAEWYEGTGSKADKKVEKALRKAMGSKAYNDLNDSAADNYKKGGANAFFKRGIEKMQATTKSVGVKAVDSKLARRVMREEDFGSLKEAKSYLADMDRKSYERYANSYAKEEAKEKSRTGTVEGIQKYTSSKAGKNKFTQLRGSSATTAKKTLVENGFTEVRGVPKYFKSGEKMGTYTGLIGPNGDVYRYQGGAFGSPASLVKASKEDKSAILAHKNRSPKSGTSKSETAPRKSKTKKSYATAKRMKPSEVADMTTRRDWVYND